MIGQAMFYANLPGEPAAGKKKKIKDKSEKEWDVAVPNDVKFQYVKVKNGYGYLMKRSEVSFLRLIWPVLQGIISRASHANGCPGHE